MEAAHEFRQQLEAYWQACERWADQELDAAPRAEALKKGGSKRRSSKEVRRETETLTRISHRLS